jgi:hypothetical protein
VQAGEKASVKNKITLSSEDKIPYQASLDDEFRKLPIQNYPTSSALKKVFSNKQSISGSKIWEKDTGTFTFTNTIEYFNPSTFKKSLPDYQVSCPNNDSKMFKAKHSVSESDDVLTFIAYNTNGYLPYNYQTKGKRTLKYDVIITKTVDYAGTVTWNRLIENLSSSVSMTTCEYQSVSSGSLWFNCGDDKKAITDYTAGTFNTVNSDTQILNEYLLGIKS